MTAQHVVHDDGSISHVVVEDWTTPIMAGLWVDGGLGGPLGFFKDPWGIVHLRGSAKTGVLNTTIFTLPVGYRPASQNRCVCLVSAGAVGAAFALIGTDGTVQDRNRAAAGDILIVDGVTFRAAQ